VSGMTQRFRMLRPLKEMIVLSIAVRLSSVM
jgi:hypothetical protein